MKRYFLYRLVTLMFIFTISTAMLSTHSGFTDRIMTYVPEPIYDGIWGTIYHAEVRQCDATPTITGDGSRINPYKASEHRWIAISQEMLDCEWRIGLLNDTTSPLYKGRIEYGDTVWIDSPYQEINGWWVVHDTKNKRYRNSIDFLQTKGDGTLYENDPMWSGKFENIKIYDSNNAKLLGHNPMT